MVAEKSVIENKTPFLVNVPVSLNILTISNRINFLLSKFKITYIKVYDLANKYLQVIYYGGIL